MRKRLRQKFRLLLQLSKRELKFLSCGGQLNETSGKYLFLKKNLKSWRINQNEDLTKRVIRKVAGCGGGGGGGGKKKKKN